MNTPEYDDMCGACQKWGVAPKFENGICTICHRKEADIPYVPDDVLAEIWRGLREPDAPHIMKSPT